MDDRTNNEKEEFRAVFSCKEAVCVILIMLFIGAIVGHSAYSMGLFPAVIQTIL